MRRFATILVSSTAAYTYSLTCVQSTPTSQQVPLFKTRKQHLQQVQNNPKYDVLIIGGGCNGVGVLLDASTRGMRTLLIEKDDFGAGASSKSTKLIHGGVRYLQQVFEPSLASLSSRWQKFKLVREAIVERGLMMDSAPHLTTKVPFVIPCTSMVSSLYYYTGSMVYYLIYRMYSVREGSLFNSPYLVNRTQMKEIFPHLNPKFTTGVVYQDGSFNDARLLLTAVLTATVGNGSTMPDSFVPANAINRAQFVDYVKNGEGKIEGAILKDTLTSKQYKVEAKYVVNCTGAFADTLRLKDNPQASKRICMVAGSHVVYDQKIASGTHGIAAPSTDGRIVLVQPWLGRVLAGTTERKLDQATNHPTCTDEERTFVNKAMMEFMSQLNIQTFLKYEKTRWCGIRPLVLAKEGFKTKDIARNHVIEEQPSGLLSLMGGKWTIYRKMGQDLVDHICNKQKEQGIQWPKSQTAGLGLLGSCSRKLRQQLLKQEGDIGVEFYHTFGGLAKEAMKGNLSRIYGSTTLAQLNWIVKNELVSSIDDVLMRRTRLCFLVSKEDFIPLVKIVGALMKQTHGWSQKQAVQEINQSIERLISYEFE